MNVARIEQFQKMWATYFREIVLDLRPKSVCAVEMTMYVYWTCIDINIKDVCA